MAATVFEETLQQVRDNDGSLVQVILDNQNLTDEQVLVLGEALKQNSIVNEISLRGNNNLTDAAFDTLIEALSTNPRITNLDVIGCSKLTYAKKKEIKDRLLLNKSRQGLHSTPITPTVVPPAAKEIDSSTRDDNLSKPPVPADPLPMSQPFSIPEVPLEKDALWSSVIWKTITGEVANFHRQCWKEQKDAETLNFECDQFISNELARWLATCDEAKASLQSRSGDGVLTVKLGELVKVRVDLAKCKPAIPPLLSIDSARSLLTDAIRRQNLEIQKWLQSLENETKGLQQNFPLLLNSTVEKISKLLSCSSDSTALRDYFNGSPYPYLGLETMQRIESLTNQIQFSIQERINANELTFATIKNHHTFANQLHQYVEDRASSVYSHFSDLQQVQNSLKESLELLEDRCSTLITEIGESLLKTYLSQQAYFTERCTFWQAEISRIQNSHLGDLGAKLLAEAQASLRQCEGEYSVAEIRRKEVETLIREFGKPSLQARMLEASEDDIEFSIPSSALTSDYSGVMEKAMVKETELLEQSRETLAQNSNKFNELMESLKKENEPLEAILTNDDQYLVQVLTCPITLTIMRDPVIAADGHTYEKRAIQIWLESHRTSPKTNLQLESTDLQPNWALKALLEHLRSRRE